MFNIRKNLSKLIACALVVGMPMATMSPAKADASVLSSVIMAGIQMSATMSQLKAYNNTEEGRQQLFSAMKEKQGVNNDPALNARLDGIMDKLTTAIAEVDPSINDMPYNYYINPETTFNAACSLGHNMTVNTGIFDLLTTDDEIAVVLGHEMGHGQKNHVMKGYQNAIPVNLLATAAAAGSGTIGAVGAGLVANYIDAVHISKPMEREADKLSFEYMAHSDYNLGATAAVWQKVIEQYGNNSSDFVGDIFSPSDHPGHEERRDKYASQLTEYSNDKVTVADGMVKINDQEFVAPVSMTSMSGAERSYFVAGNLARYYHDHADNVGNAYAYNGTVYLDNQAIMTPAEGDTPADELVARLNEIK